MSITNQRKIINYHSSLSDKVSQSSINPECSSGDISTSYMTKACNKVLIIVPGYSVSNPPKIGNHHHYINALKFHPEKNPNGYKHIYLFDLYSKKDGRCNFKYSIPQLAQELWNSITTNRDGWVFPINCSIDFIGGSMGGLIIREFIRQFTSGENFLQTISWGTLSIDNIVLIATPNHGCELIDKLNNPIIQTLLRFVYGRDNFSTSEQFQQIGIGNQFVFGRLLRRIFRKKTPENNFIEELNKQHTLSRKIRWITLRGSKRNWISFLLYGRKKTNDGIVEASRVILDGAENISDKDVNHNFSWNHRDLYKSKEVCDLLYGLLILNFSLTEYRDQLVPMSNQSKVLTLNPKFRNIALV
ncbi:MAG: hypothetical protein ACTSSB_12355 [Candidatus Heimdallarchaeota archaeon]